MGYIEEGEHYLQIGDFAHARKSFGYARRENANDWRAWFGLARVVTKNFTVRTGENWALFVDTAKSLTSPEMAAMIDAQMGDYAERQRIMNEMRKAKRSW